MQTSITAKDTRIASLKARALKGYKGLRNFISSPSVSFARA